MRILILLSAVLFTTLVQAEAPAVDDGVAKTITEKLQQARPELNYGEIKATPVVGIYQVQVAGGPLLYVTADGSHMFVGELYRVSPGQFVNLAEQDRIDMRRERLEALDEKDFIIFPAVGPTKAILNVFTDVDCGYCRRLHKEVPELNRQGVEVRYLAFPRTGLDSNSYHRIVMAWCADDRQQALTDLKNGKTIEGGDCENNPVAEQYQMGLEFGVNGTPALLLMDGTLLPGYRPADELLALLGVK